jgi:hypothetical protein
MTGNKAFMSLPVAIVFGVLGAASAAVANDHEDQGGFKVGPLGQAMGAPSYRPVDESNAVNAVSAGSAYGHVVAPSQPSQQRNSHGFQSWCDIDPNCNGWNAKMIQK